jgi:YtkA-like
MRRDETASAQPALPQDTEPAVVDGALRARRMPRRAALTAAGGLGALLGLGWLADIMSSVPIGRPTAGTLTRAVGQYQVRLDLVPMPPVAGQPTQLTATVTTRSGAAIASAAVQFTLQAVTMDMGVETVVGHSLGAGRYAAVGIFPMSGTWSVTISVAVQAQPPAAASFTVGVR